MTCQEGITLLPPETLSHVFQIVSEDAAEDSVRAAVNLSHVCRSWRRLALGTPRLWTRVELWGRWEKIVAFLERSKASLIDIYLMPPRKEWSLKDKLQDILPPDGKDEALSAYRSCIGSPDSDNYQFHATLETTRLKLNATLDAAAAHTPRWRSFNCHGLTWMVELSKINRLLEIIDAPNLQFLSTKTITNNPLPFLSSLHLMASLTPNIEQIQPGILSRLTSLRCEIANGLHSSRMFETCSHIPLLSRTIRNAFQHSKA